MHPVLFQYKYIAVYSFGAMLAIAFLCGILLIHYRAKKAQLPAQQVVDFCLWLLISAIVGARALFVVQNWDYYRYHLVEIIMVQKGGLVFYGGLILGFFFALLYFKLKKWSYWKMADVLAPALALGHGFGRIGCFLNGCCFGKLTNVPWAVQFPEGSPAANHFGPVLVAAAEFGPLHLVHPTQLYSAVSLFLLCLFLIWFDVRKKFDGQTFVLYIGIYSVLRFVLEFFRGDNSPYLMGLTLSQSISLGVLALAFFLYVKLSSKTKHHASDNQSHHS